MKLKEQEANKRKMLFTFVIRSAFREQAQIKIVYKYINFVQQIRTEN